MRISIVKPPADTYGFEAVEVKNFQTLGELCLENNISTGVFRDGHRNRANFLEAGCIGLDFDNDPKELKGITPLFLDEAKKVFSDFKHIILTSRSHQKEKNGLVTDRFRVLLILSSPITDAETFYETWHWCKSQWPALDEKCKDPSRLWYQHSSIANIQKEGKTVDPVVPKPKESSKGEIDVASLPEGTHGALSRETLQFLLTGPERGSRNGSTYKAAKEFQQNLFSLEEATNRIITSLRANDIFAADFTESEAEQTIKSAYNTEAKHDPRVKPKAFNLSPLSEIYKTEAKIEWLTEKLLHRGGVSLMSSEPKTGKSTLVRQLAREVARGGVFLGRKCQQGSVIYLALEEQIEVINESFQRLGVTPDQPIQVHIGEPLTETPLDDFRTMVLEYKPALVIVDTLFDLIDAEENNYKEVKKQLRFLRKVARESGTNILVIHHNGKGDSNPKYRHRGQRGVLGSTAITGGVDTIMVMEADGAKRFFTVTGREVNRFTNALLRFNYKECTYAVGPEEPVPKRYEEEF